MRIEIGRLVTGIAVLFLINGGCNTTSMGGPDGSGAAGAEPPSTSSDGPDDPANDLPRVHNLNGPWEDAGRDVRITQSGNSVTALYLQPYVCDHRDGTGQTDQTDLDFDATLSGDTLIGQTSTCRFGSGNPNGVGIFPADMTLTANEDDTSLTGTWRKNDTDVSFSLTRLGCLKKTAGDYGLPPGNEQTSDYDANRVYHKDGSVETVPDDYVLNPATDDMVRHHRGTDYSSHDADGNVANVPFTAGVSGTVDVLEGSDWNTINVVLDNGNVVQYLHASTISVTDGQRVTPSTQLGVTGNTGLGANGAIHLHVQAKDKNGNYINPSCAEEGISQ